MPFNLFPRAPKHPLRALVLESDMAENGWLPVKPQTLETKYPGVYAVGDCANTGTGCARGGRSQCRGERVDRQA
jgi:sulfide:quinone oxidoreductase